MLTETFFDLDLVTYFIITGAVPTADGSPIRGVGKSMAQTGNDDIFLFLECLSLDLYELTLTL